MFQRNLALEHQKVVVELSNGDGRLLGVREQMMLG